MDRQTKEAFVSAFNARLQETSAVVVGHYRGLSVAEMTVLRSKMRESGAQIEVVKNRLAKIAFDGTPYTNVSDLMKGPTAVATSSDPVAAAKAAHEFAKDHDKFVILGGALGDKALSADDVAALAKLPSLDAMRGKLIGLIQAPATKLAGVAQAPAGQLARLVAQKPESAAA